MTLNQGYSYRSRIQAGGSRLLDYLVRHHPQAGEPVWRARIEAGRVELDGRPAEAATLLDAGQELVWHRPPWEEPEVDARFGLVFLDESLVAVTKPRGLPTLPGAGYLAGTLLNLVRAEFPEASPMHRLGRETSGLVLFARTPAAAAALQAAWRGRQVEKRYRALASGVCGPESLDLTFPIGPVPHPLLGTLHAASDQGKPSRSTARVLERTAGRTLFEVLIETGRPHQIRIHLAAAGFPLVGDPLYGPGGQPRPGLTALPGDGGYFLHAERLAFPHPASGQPMELWARPPVELRTAGETLTFP
jgi:23S rRNA pseudouridine1911/1915/1917 synthase